MKTCGTGAASRRTSLLTVMMMSLAAVGCGGGGGGGGTTANNSSNSGSQPPAAQAPVPVSPFTPPAATPPATPAPAAPAPANPTPPAAAPSPAPSAGGVTLAWELPTETSAGAPLGTLAGFHIHYGTNADVLSETIVVDNPGVLTYVVDTLPAGTYYFAVRAVTTDGDKSSLSNVISKVIS